MNSLQKLTKARAGLILDAIFFGSLALKLNLKEDASAETAWTDGVSLGYNPTFIDDLTLDEVKGLLVHEVMHIALGHHCRRKGRDAKKWNIAGDHAANYLLSKFTLPEGALPGIGKSTEAIFSGLPEPDPDGSGNGNGPGEASPDPGKCGEVRDLPGKDGQPASPAELAQAEAEVKISVAQAAQQAKSCGKLTGELKKFVEELLTPVIDWKDVLRRFFDTSAKNDYSWSRPNKQYLQAGLYLPGLRSNELGNIACLVDMSGSVSKSEAAELASELAGIAEAYHSTINVIYFNHEVTGGDVYEPGDVIEISVESGGGTNYIPAFEALEDIEGEAPAVVVVLTDSDCRRFPDVGPDAPTLWAITGGGADSFQPPFGEVVAIS